MEGALVGAQRPGQRGLEAGAQGQAGGQSRELREPRETGSACRCLCAGAVLRRERHTAHPLRTWGPADVSREEPVGSLPSVRAHQVELPKVGHVEHSCGPSAGQTLLLDLKGSRVGVPWGLRDLSPRQRPHSTGLQDPLLPSSEKRTVTFFSGRGKDARPVQEAQREREP